jgi:uncharacterized protein YrrD
MLQSLNKLTGVALDALDGEIGQIKDFYFDDQDWVIRYLVADTSPWQHGNQVLISPHSLGPFDQRGKLLHVNLSKKQIEGCPLIESHKPVSRRYEEEYYRYYGLANYWVGNGLWGMSGVPILELPPEPLADSSSSEDRLKYQGADAHLRSFQAVEGYYVHAVNGVIGNVSDLMIDPQTWAVRHIIIKTTDWFSSKELQIPAPKVTRISYEESTVFVDLTKDHIERSPTHFLVMHGAVD